MEAGGLPASDNGLGPKTPSAFYFKIFQDISIYFKILHVSKRFVARVSQCFVDLREFHFFFWNGNVTHRPRGTKTNFISITSIYFNIIVTLPCMCPVRTSKVLATALVLVLMYFGTRNLYAFPA